MVNSDRENFNFPSIPSPSFLDTMETSRYISPFLFAGPFSTRFPPLPLQRLKNIAFVRSCRPDPNRAVPRVISYPKEELTVTVERNVDENPVDEKALLVPHLRLHRGENSHPQRSVIKFFNNVIHRLERNHASKRSSRSKQRSLSFSSPSP